MVALMARELGDAVHVTVPVGGTTLWTRVSPGIHVEQWRQHAAARGVIFDTGERFSFDAEPLPYALIGFARHHEAELADAVRLLAAALPLGGGSRSEVSRTRQPSSAA
jgi:DNA-binding transcriptional MocR family regulator